MVDYVTGDAPTLDDTDDDDSPDTGQGLGKDQSAALATKWGAELAASKRWLQKFTKAARACEKAYLDERDNGAGGSTGVPEESRVNLFWSNTQVILAAIYGKLPQAEVDRKFKDFDDDVSRVAAIILQRILNADLEREYDDTNAAMRDAVFDRFIVGLGQVWCRYDVDIEEYQAPQVDPLTGMPPTDPQTGQPVLDPQTGQPPTQTAQRIINEEAEVDYVYWDDFRYSPCRRWRECRWVARRVYMSRKKLRDRFKLGDDQLALVPMVSRTPGDGGNTDDVIKATVTKQAAVWEIWDKETNNVCWYVEGCAFVLDYKPDYLKLDDFFPCPEPVHATTLTRAFIPRADYAMAQDIYNELDRINSKLARLQEAVKVAGVYDKNAAGVKTLLSSNTENTLIPVENWAVFVEKGGMKGVIDWMPIEATVNAIVQLNQRKQQLQEDLYSVLGIADIMRGASAASESATAQAIKASFGGARLANVQNEIARFVSDTMRIRANIISKLFQPETILERSLIMRTPDAQAAPQAVALLKNYGVAMHSISVSADSLAAPDWDDEKATRTEFMGAVSNYLMAAAPMVSQDPSTGGFLVRLLQWGCAGFKGAASIEGVLDQAAKKLEDAANAPPPPPPPPSPQDQKDMALAGKAQADTGKAQADTQRSAAEAQRTQTETAIMQGHLQHAAAKGEDPAAAPTAQGETAGVGVGSRADVPMMGALFSPAKHSPFGAIPGGLPGAVPPHPPSAGGVPGVNGV